MSLKVICVTGMPGAGKSVFAGVAKKLGLKVINMGDVIREEAEREGVSDLGEVMLKLRRLHGEDVVARRCLSKLSPKDEVVVIEGVRSLAEVEVFKNAASEVIIVAIHASPSKRYEHLARRGRFDDPKSWEEFIERDLRELSVGLGSVIALADKMFLNEGSIENLEFQAKVFFQVFLHESKDKS
ncbi:MAG: dephospho-CoA kinase [Candidatus Methanomethylicota archaeon]|uniref:UPF0200 protein DRJ33_08880 n=1 Tax=Thermoproteota archaeon TaxID=2056631 RepID=A0A497EMX7_9CREN|nr:MAG: dephospho-CoA kinase [Candidatus Verstraetearchaeota archaeon]